MALLILVTEFLNKFIFFYKLAIMLFDMMQEIMAKVMKQQLLSGKMNLQIYKILLTILSKNINLKILLFMVFP